MRRELQALALAGVLASFGGGTAGAEDAEGFYRIHGAGTVICNDWALAREVESSARQQLEWWVAGYMTAYNRFLLTRTRVTPEWDAAAYYNWIDAYCTEQPGDRLATALERLVYRLGVRPVWWLGREGKQLW